MNIERCWHVKSVLAKPNYFLRLEFENGDYRVLDMAPMLNKRHFKALQDARLFVAVKAEEGGVLWEQGIQLAPEELWDRSRPV